MSYFGTLCKVVSWQVQFLKQSQGAYVGEVGKLWVLRKVQELYSGELAQIDLAYVGVL